MKKKPGKKHYIQDSKEKKLVRSIIVLALAVIIAVAGGLYFLPDRVLKAHQEEEQPNRTIAELSAEEESPGESDSTYGDSASDSDSENQAVLSETETTEELHLEDLNGTDVTAAFETEEDWVQTLPQDLGTDWKTDLVAVAKSQVGYAESAVSSTENAEEEAGDSFSRYGIWNQEPYEDWSLDFAAFCLHYANVDPDIVPVTTESEAEWIRLLDEAPMVQRSGWNAQTDTAVQLSAGDLVFLKEEEETPHMGIVTVVDEEGIHLIEGDRDDAVAETVYEYGSEEITAAFVLPESGELVVWNPENTQNDGVGTEDANAVASDDSNGERQVFFNNPDEDSDETADGEPGVQDGASAAEEDRDGEGTAEDAAVGEENSSTEEMTAEGANSTEEGTPDGVGNDTSDGTVPGEDTNTGSDGTGASAGGDRRTLVCDGDDYTATVVCRDDANLPENAVLVVNEISDRGTFQERRKYKSCYRQVESALGEESSSIANVRFFDLSFETDGTVCEPQAEVDVMISYNQDEALSDDQRVQALQIPKNDEALVVDAEASAEAAKRCDVSFKTDSAAVYGIVVTTIEKTVLASDGRNYHVSVSYTSDTGIPADAELEVSEITKRNAASARRYEDYVASTEDALGMEAGSADYIRLFDIRIVYNTERVQPADGTTVSVEIDLADKDDSAEAGSHTHVVHFSGGADTGMVIRDVAVNGSSIRFETDGFSAYAIVEGPEAVPIGWHRVSSVDELIAAGSEGVYIGHKDGYYFMNTLTSDGSRTGITKTKPLSSVPASDAAEYYFEQADDSGNMVYAYCYSPDGQKLYVRNTNNNSLMLTSDESEKTAFSVTQNSNGNFKFNNGAWYWNMQGGANGTRFCCYNNAGDTNNEVNIWYYSNTEEDPYGLNGTSYGLMSWSGGVAGKAMMANASGQNELEALALTVMAKKNNNSDQLFVPDDSDISLWSFEWIGDDRYYLTTAVDGSVQYLSIRPGGLFLTDTPDSNSRIRVIPGSGTHTGEICLKSDKRTLTYSGSVNTGFGTDGSTGSEWLRLVRLSDLTSEYFMTYSARKVSVSDPDITNGSRIIVYARSWNEDTKQYEFYAIDHDGSLVRCYESGDSIQWTGSRLNSLLWNFVEYYWDGTSEPNYYYDLYNQYSEQYIAPQVTGGQILSGDVIGLNLNGRRNGAYYSTILSWDNDNYAYAGLKIVDGQIVSCPFSEADDFYFAVMQDIAVDDTLTTVPTVDHTQYGITMKMIDFDTRREMSDFLGNDTGGIGTALQQNLLSTNLGADGYPTAKGGSLGRLYANAQEVNHLFIQSTYSGTGYFEYDSTENFATLKGQKSGDFTVYNELGSYDSGGNKNTLKHGQFFPFNDLQAGTFASVNGKNLYSATAVSLPESDPRKYERLYSIEYGKEKADCYFGMELDAAFTQSPDGLDNWGHDIIFEFTGDDDFWLYVDGELVIDLGGIHSAAPGWVNFRTGEVYVNGNTSTLRQVFENNYRGRNPQASEEQVAEYLSGFFADGSEIFKEYTTHTMRIFYMERGAGASNLHMRFNLASVKPGHILLSKELSGVDAEESVMAEFPYQIYYTMEEGGVPAEYLLEQGDTRNATVHYKDTLSPAAYRESITIDGAEYHNVFMLKPGEVADIALPDDAVSYRIVECGVNTDIYDAVTVKEDSNVTGTLAQDVDGNAVDSRMDYTLAEAAPGERPRVTYVNSVDPEAIRTLTFAKSLYREDGTTKIPYTEDTTPFGFRLYLASEFSELNTADMHTYHVKDPDGNYCIWDAQNQAFSPIAAANPADYSTFSAEEKEAASFQTSLNGSVSMIPPGYVVEIRNVLAGTQFRVQERPDDIPDGYSFQKYVFYKNGISSDPDRELDGGDRVALAGVTDIAGAHENPHVEIRNLKGYGLRVNKVWSDADYMNRRDPVYFAVFTRSAGGEGGESLSLVDGSVRRMSYGTTTLYWYWLVLPANGVAFDDYVIREIRLNGTEGTEWTEDASGIVTIASADPSNTVVPISDGEQFSIAGRQKGENSESTFEYTVLYDKGTISSTSNVRVDTVTNNRPGIVLKKTDWSGNALKGAAFTLEDPDQNQIGTFTSDEDGLITVAFLSDDKDYTLTETVTPQGYHGLESPMTIRLDSGSVIVNGVEEEYYTVDTTTGTPVLTIRNRPYTFLTRKTDADTGLPIQGVSFALHKQHTVGKVTSMETTPMPGYEALVTDENGIIPKLDQALPPGTYELRENTAPEGYRPLSGYIRFTVSKTGGISLDPASDQPVKTDESETDRDQQNAEEFRLSHDLSFDGTMDYELAVRNHREIGVTIHKTDASGNPLNGARFQLWKYDSSWEVVSEYSEIDMAENASAEIPNLTAGRYRIAEIEAPEGYIIVDKYTYFNVTVVDNTIRIELTDETGEAENSNSNASLEDTVITVVNAAGSALPHTGGPGTVPLTCAGILCLAGAAIILRRRCI